MFYSLRSVFEKLSVPERQQIGIFRFLFPRVENPMRKVGFE